LNRFAGRFDAALRLSGDMHALLHRASAVASPPASFLDHFSYRSILRDFYLTDKEKEKLFSTSKSSKPADRRFPAIAMRAKIAHAFRPRRAAGFALRRSGGRKGHKIVAERPRPRD
jgi:hypothetical protein